MLRRNRLDKDLKEKHPSCMASRKEEPAQRNRLEML
jgi:hypothetical protein